jgi:hypothetical protein
MKMKTKLRLLDDISEFLQTYIVMRPEEADVIALYIVHTHAIIATMFTPYLHIFSPVLRCGKTTLLDILSLLVAKPWATGRVTAAALVRKIDQEQPTLLLDESDATFNANNDYTETLRGILNTGYYVDGKYSACVQIGGSWVSKDSSTFCAKTIAGIGRLPATVEDRAIPIRLRRKLPNEACKRFRKREVLFQAEVLRCRVALWAKRHIKAVEVASPAMPNELNDRQQDVCEPLVAIADCSGGEWPARSRRALVALLGTGKRPDDSQAVELLADIRACLDQHGTDRMRSQMLVDRIISNEESLWCTSSRRRRLTQTELARLLEPFDVTPRDIRFDHCIFKGYRREDFEDAWARYLPALKGRAS